MSIGAAVDVEQTRLESVVALVWDERHYHHACACESCAETREHLDPSDLRFINHLSEIVIDNEPRPK